MPFLKGESISREDLVQAIAIQKHAEIVAKLTVFRRELIVQFPREGEHPA